MSVKPVHVGVVGSGIISEIYLENMINRFDILQVDAIASAHFENARKRAEQFGIRACSVEELMADPSIDMIVNLTPTCVHYDIIKAALMAGKHVYTEKTLTDDIEKAAELVRLADEKQLYLGSAPDTFLGASLQTARKAIDDGLIGEVTSFAAAANRDNEILTSLFSFLRMPGGGVVFDYAVYYMTALISLLGPVKRTASIIRAPYLKHINVVPGSPLYGQEMDTPNESEVSAILEFESGVSGTFHVNCDCVLADQAFFAIYGTKGILYLCDPNQFGGQVRILKPTQTFEQVPETVILENQHGFAQNSRGLGPAEMAYAILEGRNNRANKELAYHVMDVLNSLLKGGTSGQFETVSSTCKRPEPMPVMDK